MKKVEVEAADYEDATKAAVRRLFEAWKRALDATIEVPDREPAINAPPSCRGKREIEHARVCKRERERIEGEDRGGKIEKREAEIFGGCEKTAVERAGFVCL